MVGGSGSWCRSQGLDSGWIFEELGRGLARIRARISSDRKRMEAKCRPVGGAHSYTAFTLSARRHSSANGDVPISTDGSLYFVKGMPESILGECGTHTAADWSAVPLTELGRSRALAQSRRMASCGLRVLAMAYGPSLDTWTFTGIVGLEDPPREGVVESVRHLEKGGEGDYGYGGFEGDGVGDCEALWNSRWWSRY